jgi:ubiquinone/menaquinone biosynthesis C-methylase UbiE
MEIKYAEKIAEELWDLDVTPWKKHWVPIFREFSRELIRVARLSPGQLILDVGTGTGIAAFEAAKRVEHGFVIGIDRSPKMISVARANNRLRNVFFIDMDGGHMLFPDRLFARVLSNCGISPGTFPQTSRDIFRVLRDDGILILNDWHLIDVPPHRTFSETLRRHRTDSPSRKLRRWREALAILESVGNQYGDSERAVLQRAGFKRVTERTKNFQIVLPSMQAYLKMRFERIALRQELFELSPSRRRRLLTELKRSLAKHVHNGQFTFKWKVRFISAAKQ